MTWRTANSRSNKLHSRKGALGGTVLDFVFRIPFRIPAGGGVNELKLVWNNQYTDTTGEHDGANSVLLDKVSLEVGSGYVPVYFGGGRTLTLAGGDCDISSDAISSSDLSAALGVSQLDAGATGYMVYHGHLAAAGDLPVGLAKAGVGALSGASGYFYDASATTLSRDVDGAGAIVPGIIGSNPAFAFTPLLVGKHVSGEPIAVFALGDSWLSDPQAKAYHRVAFEAENIGFIDHCMGATGPVVYQTMGTDWHAYLKYCNAGHCQLGSNGAGAASKVDQEEVLAAMRAEGCVVIQQYCSPQSASTTSGAPATGWKAADTQSDSPPTASVAQRNADILAWQAEADPRFDYLLEHVDIQAPGNKMYWAAGTVNGVSEPHTPDGKHMQNAPGSTYPGHAAILAPAMVAMLQSVVLRPVLTKADATIIGTTTATPRVCTNQDSGTLYAVLVPDGDAPSAAQIKAGQDSTGAAAIFAQSATITARGEQMFAAVTGLSSGAGYECAYVHEKDGTDSDVKRCHFRTADGTVALDATSNVAASLNSAVALRKEHSPVAQAGISLIEVDVAWRCPIARTLDSVECNGVAMALVSESKASNDGLHKFALVNPPPGRQDIEARWNGNSVVCVMGVRTYRNSDAAAYSNVATPTTGSSNAPSISCATASGEAVSDALLITASATMTEGAAQTKDWGTNAGSSCYASGTHQDGSVENPAVMSNALSTSRAWRKIAASIKAAV